MSRLPTLRRLLLASLPWSSGTELSVVVTSSFAVTSAGSPALIATRQGPPGRSLRMNRAITIFLPDWRVTGLVAALFFSAWRWMKRVHG